MGPAVDTAGNHKLMPRIRHAEPTASMGPAVDTAGNLSINQHPTSLDAVASMGPAVDTAGNPGLNASLTSERSPLQWGQRLIPLETAERGFGDNYVSFASMGPAVDTAGNSRISYWSHWTTNRFNGASG